MSTGPEEEYALDKEDEITPADLPDASKALCPPDAIRCTDGCFRDKKWVRKYGTDEDKKLL